MRQIVFFTINGKTPFYEWADTLDNTVRARLYKALRRLANDNPGDVKPIAPSLYEKRLFFAGGLRIYYTEKDGRIIIIICGGDKDTQSSDIEKAKRYLAIINGGNYGR